MSANTTLSTKHVPLTPTQTTFEVLLGIESVVAIVVVIVTIVFAVGEARKRRTLIDRMQIREETQSGKKYKQAGNEANPAVTSLSYAEWRHMLSIMMTGIIAIVALIVQFATNNSTINTSMQTWLVITWVILLLSAVLSTQLSSAVVMFDTSMSLRPVEQRRFIYRILVVMIVAIVIAIVLSIVLALLIVAAAGMASSSSNNSSNSTSCNCCSGSGGGTGGGMYGPGFTPYWYFWGGYYPYGYYSPMWMYYPYWGGRYGRGYAYSRQMHNNVYVVQQNSAVVSSQPTMRQTPLTAEQKKDRAELQAILFYQPPPFYRHFVTFAFIVVPIATVTGYYQWSYGTWFNQSYMASALVTRSLFNFVETGSEFHHKVVPFVFVWTAIAMFISFTYLLNTILTIRSVKTETSKSINPVSIDTDVTSDLPPPEYTPEYPSIVRLICQLCAHLILWTLPNIILCITASTTTTMTDISFVPVYVMIAGVFVDMIGHAVFYAFVERKSTKLIEHTLKYFS